MNKEITIEVNKISKIFDLSYLPSKKNKFRALNNVSFNLYRGEKLGIIGRNGSGKSTLLKILSNVMQPSSGFAKIKGTVCSILEIGTGFKKQLTGRQNIYLYSSILGYSERQTKKIINTIILFSELKDFIDLPLSTYSSGMQSKLAFSTTIFLKPDILILDEVLAVGDIGFKQKCLDRMNELSANDQTILFVSHSHGSLRKFCNRLIWLEKGKIVKIGPTDEVLNAYEKSFNYPKKGKVVKSGSNNNKSRHFSIKKIDIFTNGNKQSKKNIKYSSKIDINAEIHIHSKKIIKNISSNLIIKKLTSIGEEIITSFPNENFIKITTNNNISAEIYYSLNSLNLLPGEYQFQFGIRGVIDDVLEKSFVLKNFNIENSKSLSNLQCGSILTKYSVRNKIYG